MVEGSENMKDQQQTVTRALRERAYYDDSQHQELMAYEGSYRSLFAHADRYNLAHPHPKIRDILERAHGACVLELGSNSWFDYFYPHRIQPKKLVCINISDLELRRGIAEARQRNVDAQFAVMDAHRLALERDSFDLVYGGGILHHLDMRKTIAEVLRVLRPGGSMLFYEPLALNPFGTIVRWLTPHRRTPDETPFGLREIRSLTSMAGLDFVCEQLVSVPMSIISKQICANYDNSLMRLCTTIDNSLQWFAPSARYLYRRIVFFGQKPLC